MPDVVTLFDGLDAVGVDRVLALSEQADFGAGETVLAQGDEPFGLYVIVSGTAEVSGSGGDVRSRRLAEVGPGAIVGEVSLLTGQPVSATVTARTDLSVRMLRPERFEQLRDEYPRLVQNLGAILARRLVEADTRRLRPRNDHVIGVRGDSAAFAESLAWHARRPVALVCASNSSLPAATSGVRRLPRAEVVAMTPDAESRRGALRRAVTEFRHVVVEIPDGGLEPEECQQVISLGPGEGDVDIGALARRVLGYRIGLAFGGGAIRGWAHYGVLRAFERFGIPVDCVAGTSVGALVAAQRALGIGADAGADFLEELGAGLFRPRPSRTSLLSAEGMKNGLRAMFGERTIEQLLLPLGITASDLGAEREVVLRSGPIWQAVLASCAIPGVYPPQRIGSRILVDGGVLNPVPSSVVSDLGADVVVGVKLTRPAATRERLPDHRPGILELVTTTFHLMQGKIASETAARASIVIEPFFADAIGFGLRKFAEGRRYVEVGEQAAYDALPRLATALPWLDGSGVSR
jgi:NTE family protein